MWVLLFYLTYLGPCSLLVYSLMSFYSLPLVVFIGLTLLLVPWTRNPRTFHVRVVLGILITCLDHRKWLCLISSSRKTPRRLPLVYLCLVTLCKAIQIPNNSCSALFHFRWIQPAPLFEPAIQESSGWPVKALIYDKCPSFFFFNKIAIGCYFINQSNSSPFMNLIEFMNGEC